PQLPVVVDLAIAHDLDAVVLVADGLLPAGQIEDREPAHPERDAGILVLALAVGPPVHGDGGHAAERLHRWTATGLERDDAVDAAHVSGFPGGRTRRPAARCARSGCRCRDPSWPPAGPRPGSAAGPGPGSGGRASMTSRAPCRARDDVRCPHGPGSA